MSTEDVEAIRQCMISLLVDSEGMRRKAHWLENNKNQPPLKTLLALKSMADRIDFNTRALYHLLPEPLRPTGIPRMQKPREPRPEGPDRRKYCRPKPGGPVPREVRWPGWTIEEILALADACKQKHGKWPHGNSGRVSTTSPDTWNGIDLALQRGNRNLPGGTSPAMLLWEYRRVRPRHGSPPFDLEQILAWADEHHNRTHSWPTSYSGAVIAAPGEAWNAIDRALRRGFRGLPGGSSLSRLLAEKRGVPSPLDKERLTEEQILAWADAHYARTGQWPTSNSGEVQEAPQETWKRIDYALIQGNRSLPNGSSLARLLASHRGVRNRKALPPFDIEQILQWADRHYERHGRWPTCWSGRIDDVDSETWNAVDSAFKQGGRGLAASGYHSLAHLLDARRPQRHP